MSREPEPAWMRVPHRVEHHDVRPPDLFEGFQHRGPFPVGQKARHVRKRRDTLDVGLLQDFEPRHREDEDAREHAALRVGDVGTGHARKTAERAKSLDPVGARSKPHLVGARLSRGKRESRHAARPH